MAPTTTAASAWDWALAVLPFTALITYIVTMVSCNLVSNYSPGQGNLLQVSHLYSGSSNIYLIVGLILIVPQVISIFIGRLGFLLQNQGLIDGIVLNVSHLLTFLPFVIFLIMGLVNSSYYLTTGTFIIYGILASFALYCIINTIVAFYLFIRKALGTYFSKIYIPIWFLICTLMLIAFSTLWIQSHRPIYGYIALLAPFLYFLGYVPQFWARARARKRYGAVSTIQRKLEQITK